MLMENKKKEMNLHAGQVCPNTYVCNYLYIAFGIFLLVSLIVLLCNHPIQIIKTLMGIEGK